MNKRNYGIIFIVVLAMAAVVVAYENEPMLPYLNVRNISQWNISQASTYITNQEPDPAEPGGYVDVRFKVENIGGSTAKDVVFQLLPAYPFSIEPGDNTMIKVGDIHIEQVGENALILYYRLRVDPNAVEGDNEIRLMYSLDGGIDWVTLPPFQIRVQPHDMVLSVDSVVSDPTVIKPGETAKVTIKLINLADAEIKNLKVNLQLLRPVQTATSLSYIELPFSPVGSSNEKTIGSLASRHTAIFEFDLAADATAAAGVHKLPILISYQDKLGKNYSISQITSLEVGEEPELVVSLDENELHSKGQLGDITVKFVNKGSSQVKFVYAKLKETDQYTLVSSPDIYVGNIDSDDYNTASFKMYIKDGKGSISLPLHVEYRDSRNNKYSQDVNLTLPTYTDDQIRQLGLQKTSSSWIYLLLIVVIVAGFFIYRRWKKAKKKDKKQ